MSSYAHVKQNKLETRALKCVMIGYRPGVKGYKLWCINSHKFTVTRDVTFNEKVMSLKITSNQFISQMQGTHFEVELNKKNGNASSSTSVSDIDTHSPSEEDQLIDYKLARERIRREIKPSARFFKADVVSFALIAAMDLDCYEPRTYHGAITYNKKGS